MGKVGFISDLHLDINKIMDEEAELTLKSVIKDEKLDILILAGDTYNNFERTQALTERLNEEEQVSVYFLAGNHDMARGTNETSIEETHPNYLHKQSIDISDSDIRIIGHNGWYDYTWASEVSEEQAWAFHQGLSFDRVVPQSVTDIERTNRALGEMETMFKQAELDKKQVVFVTHFVPVNDDLYVGEDKRIQLVNAIMGSKRIGELIKRQDNMKEVVFGHQHINPPTRYYESVPYTNVAVGIKRRRKEWSGIDLLDTIQKKMHIFLK